MALPMGSRDQRALLLLGAAVLIAAVLQLDIFTPGGGGSVAADSGSIEAAEQRLMLAQVRSRQLPLAESEFEGVKKQLDVMEQGLLKSETAALAQAEMRQIAGDLMAAEGISMESSQFGQVQLESVDYALVPLNVDFQCGIEQFVNLMAAISNAPQLLTTKRIRLLPVSETTKTVRVQMILAGLLPASRTPDLKPKSTTARTGS